MSWVFNVKTSLLNLCSSTKYCSSTFQFIVFLKEFFLEMVNNSNETNDEIIIISYRFITLIIFY